MNRSLPPSTSEYAEYYARYIARVPEADILSTLDLQGKKTSSLLRSISNERSLYRYAPDKWSIRELIGHITDTERVFVYRAMRFARNDRTELPGFDENEFVKGASFDTCPWENLIDDFEAQRRATTAFFTTIRDDEWLRSGTANKNALSVRAAAWIIAGHELHHVNIINGRYLT